MKKLGVNIDHVATLRQARGVSYPSVVEAARISEAAGASGITIHLREDRRHIQDADVFELKKTLTTKMNLELAATDAMTQIALRVKPEQVCLVPEKREELNTEGGLDVVANLDQVAKCTRLLSAAGCEVSLFIDADRDQVSASVEAGAQAIEIHTGHYADCLDGSEEQLAALEKIKSICAWTRANYPDLIINAGHGLTRQNVQAIAQIPEIHELNIGHAIVADAVFVGLRDAVTSFIALITEQAA